MGSFLSPLNTYNSFKDKIRQGRFEAHEITDRQLALILGDSFIKGSGLEGGSVTDQASYWRECVVTWRKPSNDTLPMVADSSLDHQGLLDDLDDVTVLTPLIHAGDVAGILKELG